jgi:hypothetical protein
VSRGPATDARAVARETVFAHLAGIAIAPTVCSLADRQLFAALDASPAGVRFEALVRETRANPGYLRVALRLLTSCGWLTQRGEPSHPAAYSLTDVGRASLELGLEPYRDVVEFLPRAVAFDEHLFGASDDALVSSLSHLVRRSRGGWGLVATADRDAMTREAARRIVSQANGGLIGPAMVALARNGILERLQAGPADLGALPGNPRSLSLIVDLFEAQGWARYDGSVVSLTDAGQQIARLAPAYGVTVSYLPMFSMLPTLLFGNARVPRVDEHGFELLVNRAMNVWGSGGSHRTYFNKVDDIVEGIFNRPLHLQPRGICDIGCGDGTFLDHLYHVITERTLRGRELHREPLIMIGADVSKVARRITGQTLRKAGIPAFHVIHGDILRPAQLAGELEKLNIDSHDLLHIRSFLDHNRPWAQLAGYTPGARAARTSGAFAYLGEEIAADEQEENLVRHLRRWAPYSGRFGLLVLELHTLPPELTAANVDRTPVVAYDATHGYSDQYLVEAPVFVACAEEAGLRPDPRVAARFPPSELATVTLNFFTTPQE